MKRFVDIVVGAYATWALAAANIAVYLAGVYLANHLMLDEWMFSASSFRLRETPWIALSHIFLHLSPVHLAVNTIALICAGVWFQQRGSSMNLIITYLAGGLFGAAFFLGICMLGDIHAASLSGCSAAVWAILSAAVVLHKGITLKLSSRPLHLNEGVILAVLAIIILSGLTGPHPGGAMAHLGGFLTGILTGLFFKRKSSKKINPLVKKAEQSGFLSLSELEREHLASYSENYFKN